MLIKDYFLKEIKKLGVSKKDNILLAVSGGIDSMTLMHLLYQNDYSFSIAHCNFSLRGKESDNDQEFIESISRSKKIEIFVKKFNTKEYVKQNKISIQMGARELRYRWFNNLRKKHNFNFIATAHHRNDSVETLLINLIRGTGISGLHGIKMLDNYIIRPLLSFDKNDIIKYAKDNNILYREDSSNRDDQYIRNKIRNKIIPIMKEINPDVINSINKTILKIRDIEIIYRKALLDKKEKLLTKSNNEYVININLLLHEPSPKQLLYELISAFGFFDIDAVFASLNSDSGKEFFNSDFYMIKDRHALIISKHILHDVTIINEKTTSIKNPCNIKFTITSNSKVEFKNKGNKIMHIDYSKLEFPLLIRSWKHGDSFIPLGMKGFKKVSDYFIDNKFSLIKKKKTRLLISNNKIVCIIGERLDDRFKLVENSKKVYIVNL